MKLAALILIPWPLAGFGCPSMGRASSRIDAHVPSNSATVVWGYLPAGRPPVLTIRSGQTVKIDTVSHQGLLSGMDPVKFFGAAGTPPHKTPPGASGVYAKAPRPENPRA